MPTSPLPSTSAPRSSLFFFLTRSGRASAPLYPPAGVAFWRSLLKLPSSGSGPFSPSQEASLLVPLLTLFKRHLFFRLTATSHGLTNRGEAALLLSPEILECPFLFLCKIDASRGLTLDYALATGRFFSVKDPCPYPPSPFGTYKFPWTGYPRGSPPFSSGDELPSLPRRGVPPGAFFPPLWRTERTASFLGGRL